MPAGEVTGYHHDADLLGRHLGVPLSPSIHGWAAFAADLAVTLLTLIEGDVCWGVRHEYLADEDPPVDTWHLDPSGSRSPRWLRQHTPTTSQFALQQLIGYLHPAAGGITVSLPPSPGLIERLRGIGRTSINLDSQVLIEDDDLVILAGKSPWVPGEETGITIQAEIGASRTGSIPQLLIDLARSGEGMLHGAFTGLRRR